MASARLRPDTRSGAETDSTMVMKEDNPTTGALSPRSPEPSTLGVQGTPYPKAVAVLATVAALYFGRDIFMPLAIAVLLTFALAPLVSMLRKIKLPRPVAVVSVVFGAFAAIVIFGMIVATQLGSLAQNLPSYQNNIETKVRALKDAHVGQGVFERISKLFDRLGREIQTEQPPQTGTPVPAEEAVKPMPVEIVQPAPQALQVLQTIVGPLIEPLATGGIIIVVVIFMLMKREDLRDRFIRLVGAGDLHRTTEALQDAGKRVGRYLLMQLVVNVTYGVPIAIGLWIIGVPNALLWGLMALVFRFVPFIGAIISSIFPLALAVAVDPGWTMLFWTIALFVMLELLSNNVIEPWLYGLRTGLSSLAIIISAIFWTWLWGPVGLLLSTPLTVCLVVLGRHVPQFEFLDVLFGNQPVLEPHQQLYQRLLAGDPQEATDRAEIFLDDHPLITFYETVAMPALALGERDRARGVMGADRRQRVAESANTLVHNLLDYAEEESLHLQADADDAKGAPPGENQSETASEPVSLPDGTGRTVTCIGGRGELDDAAAAMFAQVLQAQGAATNAMQHTVLEPGHFRSLSIDADATVVIVFLNAASKQHARYIARRLRRFRPALRIGVLLWDTASGAQLDTKSAADIGCDFVSYDLSSATHLALSDERVPVEKSKPIRSVRKRMLVKASQSLDA